MHNESVSNFLLRHAAERPVSFHMPGHKGSEIYRRFGYGEFLNNIMDCDITEIPGADNLFQQEDVILEVMQKYKKLYGSKKTYLLVNGSSAGIIAAILSLVNRSEKLIMARNCHKSVFNAVSLGGIEPLYVYPETVEGFGIQGEIKADELELILAENPETRAVIIPSPNYYGICSDIEKISEICHRKGVYLIVDQAHGAHLKFMDELKKSAPLNSTGNIFPLSAELAGADIVINSTHKTLASFTQTAILNIMNEDIDLKTIEDKLQILESSSPSYPLLASLDINADILLQHGDELIREWVANIDYFYENAKKIYNLGLINEDRLDRTKINIDMSKHGFCGHELEELMMEEGIFAELVTGNILMCMTGIGNVREDFDRLLKFLGNLATRSGKSEEPIKSTLEEKASDEKETAYGFRLKNFNMVPKGAPERTAIPAKKELIDISESEGRVCAGLLIPYPPGIPLICPGEIMTREIIDYVIMLRNSKEKVIGIDENGRIAVGI